VEPKAPSSSRFIAEQTDAVPRRPIRRFRGSLVPFDGTSLPDFAALDAAVRLARRPDTGRLMRAAPVPKGVLTLFRILSEAEEPTALAARRLRRDPAFVRFVAAFYVEHVLWTGDPDHYRVLGVGRHAPQEEIDENLSAALAWLTPYAGTQRWEGDFAAAVAAAGRAIGTEDDRLAYDLAAWSDLAAVPPAPVPRKTLRRTASVAVASLALFTLMGGNFLASGTADAPTAGHSAKTSGPAEADESIAVVRVKVVKGQDPAAAVPPPEPKPVSALLAESDEPPATSAPIDLLNEAAAPPPDFNTAFEREDAAPEGVAVAPEGDANVASTAPAESLPAPPAATAQPPTAITPIDETAGVTDEAAPKPLADSTELASLADGTEGAPAATGELIPTPQPVEAPKELALAAKEEPVEAVAAAAPPIAASPSFKCSRARTEVELAICADPALAGKDRDLARLYRHVRGSLAGSSRAFATSRQMAWLKDRDSCGGSATCILNAYDSRIRELATELD
jgi:uncharacterized protein YecT (DUF1311 family)